MNLFQHHSQTSTETAYVNTAFRGGLERRIYSFLKCCGNTGMTGDEVSKIFNIPIGTASARMRGLQLKELIRKSSDTRKTRSGVAANVWKLAEYVSIEHERK